MSILENGYEIVDGLLSQGEIKCIKGELEAVGFPAKVGGIRNAEKKFSTIRELAASKKLVALANNYLPGEASLVRAILFNKTEENNWLVTWHQDKTVAVSDKFEKESWGPWSTKNGVPHVQPPIEVLNQMVTVRIHLDDAGLENGCLKMLPKSHSLGVLDHTVIQEYVKNHDSVTCEASAGSALVMRPLILHSSSKSSNPSQRRVLHLEYSSFKLPAGVTWAFDI
ncbi:MAG: phytanoyl-CoA dioxygenase family protein [Cellvibrionaceae bacterium]|nr:phytanoyl-CoA dioxygenase family protein [Cellvibrionaceae bacterium]